MKRPIWIKPEFHELNLSAEIGLYYDDWDGGDPWFDHDHLRRPEAAAREPDAGRGDVGFTREARVDARRDLG